MAITAPYEDSATISTTEYSLTNDSTTLAAQTTAGEYYVYLDLSAMADGDIFECSIYEKVQSGGTQRIIETFTFSNAQGADDAIAQLGPFMLINGWDVSVTKLAGTDRSIGWSIRYDNMTETTINAEVVDALNTDTYAEPGQGAPAATATLAAKIGYLYKAWRNKSTQTSTTYTLFADDTTTADQKSTDSDDGTTFTKGEVGTGA